METVRDSGPGVPEEDRARIFEAFESTKNDGMGMGLAISRSLIENHNGKLFLDIEYDASASFDLLLSKIK